MTILMMMIMMMKKKTKGRRRRMERRMAMKSRLQRMPRLLLVYQGIKGLII
jgi:hypothetical protein